MAKVYYGCDERKKDWDTYAEHCNAIELDLTRLESEPRLDTLNQWRVETPKGFCFILRAAPDVGGLLAKQSSAPDSEKVAERLGAAWEDTLEKASALAAKAILVDTPRELSPSESGRDVIGRFGEEFASDAKPAVLWNPSGLWGIEATKDVAREAGLSPVYDPFIARREGLEFAHGDVGFTISERAAMRRQFDVFDFKQLLQQTDNYDRLFVMFRGRFKWEHAQKMQIALQHSASRG